MDETAIRLLRDYKPVIDGYMVDFFVEDHWKRLPDCWKDVLEKADNKFWVKVLDPSAAVGALPLSFLCLRKLFCHFIRLRQGVDAPRDIVPLLPKNGSLSEEKADSFSPVASKEQLRVRVKEKKRHEIDRILSLMKILHDDGNGFDFAVDVGAGLGHLSRILAVEMPSVGVQTIEGNSRFVELSSEFDVRTVKRLGGDVRMPSRVERFLDPGSSASFDEGLGKNGVLLGLHPCGDLSATILRSFLAFENISSLVLFGCCYHKLNGGCDKVFRQDWEATSDITASNVGFPLSQHFSDVELSYAARELACHAVEQFVHRHKELPTSKCHFFRSLLEFAVLEHAKSEKERHIMIKGVKNSDSITFREYVEKALTHRPDIQQGTVQQVDEHPFIQQVLSNAEMFSRRALSFYCVRLLLAPFVEHILISDRVSFIQENGYSASAFALFNPVNSPRNIVVVAQK